MRFSTVGFLVLALASAALGGQLQEIDIALGKGVTGGTGTLSQVSGYLEDIQVSVTGGGATGCVFIATLRPDSVVAAVNVGTNIVTGTKLFRPAVDFTDVLGAALTSDPPRRQYLYGETMRMIVTHSSATGVTWRARIKTAAY